MVCLIIKSLDTNLREESLSHHSTVQLVNNLRSITVLYRIQITGTALDCIIIAAAESSQFSITYKM